MVIFLEIIQCSLLNFGLCIISFFWYMVMVHTDVLFLRFRAGVKDLEVMVQNLISSAFDTITTVQEGVEILDIFQHLSSREVL